MKGKNALFWSMITIFVWIVLIGIYISKQFNKEETKDTYFKTECIIIDKNLVCDASDNDKLYYITGIEDLDTGTYIVVYHNGVMTLSFPQDFSYIDHIEVIEEKKATSDEIEPLKMNYNKYFKNELLY